MKRIKKCKEREEEEKKIRWRREISENGRIGEWKENKKCKEREEERK